MPRMDSITRVGLNVGADQNGMQVYDTDSKSFWYYDHSIPKWLEIKDIADKFVDGVPASTAVYTTGNVGIGTDSPTENVHVMGNMFSEDTLAGQKLVIGPHSNVLATGGTITTAGHYTVHTFTSSGTFMPNGNTDIEYLVVGGGGAGGATNSGDAQADGRDGGSGGGAAEWYGSFNGGANAYHGAVGGAGTAGQGNNGGSSALLDVGVPAAGGGGAGGAGAAR